MNLETLYPECEWLKRNADRIKKSDHPQSYLDGVERVRGLDAAEQLRKAVEGCTPEPKLPTVSKFAKFSRETAESIRLMCAQGVPQTSVAKQMGVSRSTICHLINRRYYK